MKEHFCMSKVGLFWRPWLQFYPTFTVKRNFNVKTRLRDWEKQDAGTRLRTGDQFFLWSIHCLLQKVHFLSPPVRMHGGLLCIAFCMSGWQWLDQNSLDQHSYLSNRFKFSKGKVFCFGKGRWRAFGIGRWAHFNVKLHFLLLLIERKSCRVWGLINNV